MLEKQEKRIKRHNKIRAKVSGTKDKPRLCVFRSAKHIYAQLIDDDKRKTIVSVKDSEVKVLKSKPKEGEKEMAGKVAKAFELGKLLAQKATEEKIEKVVFDRGGYKYHGRVKALADGAREGGLKF